MQHIVETTFLKHSIILYVELAIRFRFAKKAGSQKHDEFNSVLSSYQYSPSPLYTSLCCLITSIARAIFGHIPEAPKDDPAIGRKL